MTALHSQISDRFKQFHDQPAIALPRGKSLSYGELAARIRAVQGLVTTHKPQAVGILSTRSPTAVTAVLAAFFCGVRFVPMNPELPTARLKKIVGLSGVQMVLHDGKRDDVDDIAPDICVDISTLATIDTALDTRPEIDPEAFAYHMFTSGSTGEPKGVPIRYQSLAHYVHALKDVTDLTQTGGRFSHTFDLSFDLAMHDIFVCFSNGGTLVPASDIDLMMPHAYIQKKKIDYWFSVPLLASMAVRGLNGKTADHHLRMAMFCGEQLPTDYAAGFQAFLDKDCPLFNLYGPTEATIAFTAKRFGPDDAAHSVVTLGAPFGDNRVKIETDDGNIVDLADGCEGELLLGGPQVFSGYVPHTAADCFVGSPKNFYRSGDIVAVSDGALHHLGRRDGQIKLRGYRIELGDIEAAFRKVFGCSAAAAVVLGDGDARKIAVAYEADSDIASLDTLQSALPDYMIPTATQRLDKLPTNINGKIDRKALIQGPWTS
jgi:D-alanine--poly(phosphoribitol) ligase subunit 1